MSLLAERQYLYFCTSKASNWEETYECMRTDLPKLVNREAGQGGAGHACEEEVSSQVSLQVSSGLFRACLSLYRERQGMPAKRPASLYEERGRDLPKRVNREADDACKQTC